MRKLNAIVSMGIIGLLLLHGIAGGFQMMGLIPGGSTLLAVLAWIMMALIAVHMGIGVILTGKTIRISTRSGAAYKKENRRFWIRRISGFALMLLVFLHLLVFVRTGNGVFRLHDFGMPEFVGQLLLLVSLAVHLLSNIKPLAIALGVYSGAGYGKDVLWILSIILAFCAVAFVIYYLRWNVLWR